jgi:hypothetical protein
MWNPNLDKSEAALVVLLPAVKSPLWDPEMRSFLESIEDDLEGVFVTHATSDNRHPTLVDALAAARFFGSTSAVVIDLSGGATPVGDADWPLPFTFAQSLREAESVVQTFVTCAGLHRDAMVA